MELTAAGRIVERIWLLLPHRFPRVTLDAFVVMPNHIHGILVVHEGAATAGEAAPAPRPKEPRREQESRRDREPLRPAPALRRTQAVRSGPGALTPAGVAAGSLGAVVRAFKSATARRINTLRGAARAQAGSPVWQRSYYEHVIRDDEDLARIRRYIADNPYRWDQDEHNPNSPRSPRTLPPP
jgi:REP element-mobilizing transposase RayT